MDEDRNNTAADQTIRSSAEKDNEAVKAQKDSELTSEQNAYYWKCLLPFTLLMLLCGTLARIYWRDLYSMFKAYPSDIWYIYNNYGYYLVRKTMFNIEYPMPMLLMFKLMAKAASLLPGMELNKKYHTFIFTYNNWILINSLVLWPLGCLTVRLIHKLNCRYFKLPLNTPLWGLVLTPAFFYFSFYNYDLPPIVCSAAALWYFLEKKHRTACFTAGLGFALKVYPGLMFPLFFLCLPNWKQRIECTLAFIVPWIVLNVPFMLFDYKHWVHPYIWQAKFDSAPQPGHLIYHLTQAVGKLPALTITGGIMLVFILWAYSRRSKNCSTNPLWLARCSLVLIASFILLKNVFSPQYLLWMSPFIALVGGIPSFGFYILAELLSCVELTGIFYWKKHLPEFIIFCRFIRNAAVIWVWVYTIRRLMKAPEETTADLQRTDAALKQTDKDTAQAEA